MSEIGSLDGLPKKSPSRNPVKMYREYRTRKKLENERLLLQREEKMKEDLERYLMEIEEQRCWLAYQLNHVNYQRMRKLGIIRKMQRIEQERTDKQTEDSLREDGLSFYQGNVDSYKRWQNSPAKYRDFLGHKDSVTSCKFSPDYAFIMSCSADLTIKLWRMESGECVKTFTGHGKVVNDGDFHPSLFKMFSQITCLLSCSGDGTLRLWNTSDTSSVSTVLGHESAVYRCSFSPDGSTFVSCSEDHTVRTWNFPEGYNLFVFRAHSSPVTSVRYSHSSRYLLSGSDYGERKILLWDAKAPHFYEPSQFPHVLVWSTAGLIKKLLIRKETPRVGFWLAQSQLSWIASDDALDIWPGMASDDDDDEGNDIDNDDPDDDSDHSDHDDNNQESKSKKNKGKKADLFRVGDIYESNGITIEAMKLANESSNPNQEQAQDYNPGGTLIIRITSKDYLIDEGFLTVHAKNSEREIFSSQSGLRLGSFSPESPIPWLPMLTKMDSHGRRQTVRAPMVDAKLSGDGHSLIYRPVHDTKENPMSGSMSTKMSSKVNSDFSQSQKAANNAEVSYKSQLEVVWLCPEPNQGPAVITFTGKLITPSATDATSMLDDSSHSIKNKAGKKRKGDPGEWIELRMSLKESPIRVNAYATNNANDSKQSKKFDFNQEERHTHFWNYVRAKEWKSAAAFIDKSAVCYLRDEEEGVIHRRFRIMNLLVSMFDECSWMIVHTPFIYRAGYTKAVVICDSTYSEDGNGDGDSSYADHDQVADDQQDGLEGDVAGGEERGQLPTVQEGDGEEEEQSVRVGGNSHFILYPANDNNVNKAGGEDENEEDKLTDDNQYNADDQQQEDAEERQQQDEPGEFLDLPLQPSSAFARERPRAGPLDLPKVIMVKPRRHDLDAHYVTKATASQAEKETSLLIDCLSKGFEVSMELSVVLHSASVLLAVKEQLIHDANDEEEKRRLLSHDDSDQHHEAHSKHRKRLEELDFDHNQLLTSFNALLDQFSLTRFQPILPTNTHHTTHFEELKTEEPSATIKSGKYGPEIEEFSMLLPTNYPAYAGDAKYALQPALQHFQSVLDKLKVESLPKTLAEVYVPTLKENISTFYHRLNKTELKHFRQRLLMLIHHNLQLQYIEDHSYTATRRISSLQLPGLSSHYPNPFYTVPAIITPETEFTRPEKKSGGLGFNKLFGRSMVASTQVAHVGRRPDHQQMLSIQNALYNNAYIPQVSYTLDKVEYEVDVLDNLVPNEHATIEAMNHDQAHARHHHSSDGHNKRFSLTRRHDNGHYPLTFYAGRRAVYGILPGLQDFQQSLTNDALTSISDTVMDAADDDNNAVVPVAGLVRRFLVNGRELAHHGAVNEAIFSPSELRIATAGGDGLIKIWDPRDGSFVRSLHGHGNQAVMSLAYTATEQFLISAGADRTIIIWSLLTQTIQRTMRGHVDVINRLSIFPDGSLFVTASHDHTLKTWVTTPRRPEAPDPPKILSFTDSTVFVAWTAPPSFNLDITAFHIQQRVGIHGDWTPAPKGKSVAPHLRNRVMNDIIAAAPYQFRLCAENAMGRSDWSSPSPVVKTLFGRPEQPERPVIGRITKTSLHILWFTPNPATYGAASQSFEVQASGDGLGYDQWPTIQVTLPDAIAYGKEVLAAFTAIEQRYLATKDKLVKSQAFNIRNRQTEDERNQFEVSAELSSDHLLEMLRRSEDETFILVGCEYSGLRPGFLYSIRLRGSNVTGAGDWSEASLSVATLPTLPSTPNSPRIAAAKLRSITFMWDPPEDDGGTAITGYRLCLQNANDRTVDLPRSTVSYTWGGLFPGRSYRLCVQAKNSVGSSPFSPLNSLEESYTMTAPPELPTNPLAVAGGWDSLSFEIDTPYPNGAAVTHFDVELRTVAPFLIGEWIPAGKYDIHDATKVEIVSYVDLQQQQEEMEQAVRDLEIAARSYERGRATKGQKVSNKAQQLAIQINSTTTVTAKSSSNKQTASSALEAEIEALILSQKPVGSRIRFTSHNLQQDTMYEARVRFFNNSGPSEYSPPSHRAKTNKAALPAACEVPIVLQLGASFILIEMKVPHEGGSPVRYFHVEDLDLDQNATNHLRCSRNELDTSDTITFRISNLMVNTSHILRCRAESAVGLGPFSPWTTEITLLEESIAGSVTAGGGGGDDAASVASAGSAANTNNNNSAARSGSAMTLLNRNNSTGIPTTTGNSSNNTPRAATTRSSIGSFPEQN